MMVRGQSAKQGKTYTSQPVARGQCLDADCRGVVDVGWRSVTVVGVVECRVSVECQRRMGVRNKREM